MLEDHQYEKQFAARLTQLRMNKGVSAREMSLDIGQNPAYINNIETGKAFPSMMCFFYICEYLEITPVEFFDTSTSNPDQIIRINDYLKYLTRDQLGHIEAISHDLAEKNQKKRTK
ncbi:MAG: helix-turn-helix domain-containing protein [Lachnospiraceae bacterium]|nr:helix-turn-helix domain-containing protein [Lachnospiraceae bacterium]